MHCMLTGELAEKGTTIFGGPSEYLFLISPASKVFFLGNWEEMGGTVVTLNNLIGVVLSVSH